MRASLIFFIIFAVASAAPFEQQVKLSQRQLEFVGTPDPRLLDTTIPLGNNIALGLKVDDRILEILSVILASVAYALSLLTGR